MSGDSYKRREVAPGRYQCGCCWERVACFGDVLRECVFHKAATRARVDEFERKRKGKKEENS